LEPMPSTRKDTSSSGWLRMNRWAVTGLLACLLLAIAPKPAQAQIDIPVQTLGNYFQAGHNLTWGNSGTGGFNNNFVLPGLGGITVNLCVYVQNNNPSSNHTFSLKSYVTSNPTVNTFTNNSVNWSPVQVLSPIFVQGSQWVANSEINPYLITGATGAKIALSFSGATTQTGSPDTANIWGMYTYGTSCSSFLSGNPTFSVYRAVGTSPATIYVYGKNYTSSVIGDPSSLSACTFNLTTANTAGTTPTINAYIQDNDISTGTTDDRISFLQETTGSVTQQATINLNGNVVPHSNTNATLAAGTIQNGKFTDNIILYLVPGGTSESYNVTLTGHCN